MEGAGIFALSPMIPFAAAILLPFRDLTGKNRKLIYTLSPAVCNLALSLYLVCRYQGQSLVLFRITEKIPILLRIDGLSVVYLILTSLLCLGVVLYSNSYIQEDRFEKRYYAFLFAVLGSLMGIALAGNIVTFYLFYELMALATFPLICHGMTEITIKAAVTFLIYSIFGATLVLIGIVLLNNLADISSFTAGGVLGAQAAGQTSRITIALLLMLFGFGCKAGMYPLQAWLPIAHPAAPSSISAVLSALITKTGVIGIIRTVYYLIGVDFLRGAWIHYLWLTITLVTIFIGSALAFQEPFLKKRLAYSSVSQISYILFGLAILAPAGFTGAVLQLIFHAFAKLILFLCAGAIIRKTHSYNVGELKGMGKKMPVVMWCFALSSLSLIGIPPMGGFLGKWYLIQASLNADIGIFSWLGPVVILISAFFTAGYLLSIIIDAFFPGADYDYANLTNSDPDWRMKGPLVVLTGFAILMGLLPFSIISYISEIAGGLMGMHGI